MGVLYYLTAPNRKDCFELGKSYEWYEVGFPEGPHRAGWNRPESNGHPKTLRETFDSVENLERKLLEVFDDQQAEYLHIWASWASKKLFAWAGDELVYFMSEYELEDWIERDPVLFAMDEYPITGDAFAHSWRNRDDCPCIDKCIYMTK